MKKILIPSLLATCTAPVISLVGCSEKGSISWDFVKDGDYQYQSGQFSGSASSWQDATSKYFDQITPQMLCDEVVNSMYKNQFLKDKDKFSSYKVDIECTKLDKVHHKISLKATIDIKDKDGLTVSGIEEYSNVPYDLKTTYSEENYDWVVRPAGTYPDSIALSDVLKNDHTWFFKAHIINDRGIEDHFINWESTDEGEIAVCIRSSYFISTYMDKVPDSGK